MKKIKGKLAVVLSLMLVSITGCGDGSNRNMQSQNAVDNAIQGQIAKEEAKTASATTGQKEDVSTEAATQADTQVATQSDSTEEKTAKKFTEATTEKKDFMEEIKESYIETPDASVDIDLTAMGSDMVYATVYQMVYESPQDYVGKKIKMRGAYTTANSTMNDLIYHYVIIKDAAACCSQGLEFVWGDGSHADSEYPELGTEVEVIGVYETYTEEGDPYLYSRIKGATMKLIDTSSGTTADAR